MDWWFNGKANPLSFLCTFKTHPYVDDITGDLVLRSLPAVASVALGKIYSAEL